MRLIVNGQERESQALTLADLWRAETAELELPGPQGFAMALNGAVVRQAAWAATHLTDGDRVEIVRAMQGG
jgi:sulfur carrier protein